MRSLCSPAFYVPGIGMGWRGVSRENADGWPWRAITKRLTSRACMALTAQGVLAWWPQAVARSRSARLLRDRPLPPTQKREHQSPPTDSEPCHRSDHRVAAHGHRGADTADRPFSIALSWGCGRRGKVTSGAGPRAPINGAMTDQWYLGRLTAARGAGYLRM